MLDGYLWVRRAALVRKQHRHGSQRKISSPLRLCKCRNGWLCHYFGRSNILKSVLMYFVAPTVKRCVDSCFRSRLVDRFRRYCYATDPTCSRPEMDRTTCVLRQQKMRWQTDRLDRTRAPVNPYAAWAPPWYCIAMMLTYTEMRLVGISCHGRLFRHPCLGYSSVAPHTTCNTVSIWNVRSWPPPHVELAVPFR